MPRSIVFSGQSRRASSLGNVRLYLVAILVAPAIVWGLRLTILQGFVYQWPLGFRGDFHAAMYEPEWWNGTGIMYGPVFVIERWLVNAWPRVFTPYFFAVANAPLIVAAFILSCAAVRGTPIAVIMALALWLCFHWLFYAFSVSANPEIIELFLLTLAWYGASRAKPTVAWTSTVVAALTKVIPVVFAPLLILRASPRAVGIAALVGLAIVATVGVGQNLGPKELLIAVAIPSQNVGNRTVVQATHIAPVPSSLQILGLSSALARAQHLSDDDPGLPRVQRTATAATIILYVSVAIVGFQLLSGGHALIEVTRLSLAYGLFFALMPLATFHTHPHTFIFLLPVWTILAATLTEDRRRGRRLVFGLMFLIVFVFAWMPTEATIIEHDRLGSRYAGSALLTDPIWSTVALVVVLSIYAIMRMDEGRTSAHGGR